MKYLYPLLSNKYMLKQYCCHISAAFGSTYHLMDKISMQYSAKYALKKYNYVDSWGASNEAWLREIGINIGNSVFFQLFHWKDCGTNE